MCISHHFPAQWVNQGVGRGSPAVNHEPFQTQIKYMNQGDKGILKRWTYQQMKRRDELPALDHKLHQSHPPKDFGIFLQPKEHSYVDTNL